MKCKQCDKIHHNKTFCSHACRNEWTRINNLTNNPIHNNASLKKMKASLTGKKLSQEVKDKMSATHIKIIKDNPELLKKMLVGAETKYLSKIRGTSWRLIRLKALDRDQYKCQNCGEDKRIKLLVHHIDWQGKRRGISSVKWNNRMSNLTTLCYKCHNGIHRHKSKDYQTRLNDQIAP